LLLNSDRGAGGAVVSKEKVAAGRKGGGGAHEQKNGSLGCIYKDVLFRPQK
jgi:hypothetical protein